MTPEVRRRSPEARPAARRTSRPSARWAPTAGSASAGRRSTAARAAGDRAVHLHRRGAAGRCAGAVAHDQHRSAPTLMHFGTDEQKRVLPARDPRRRDPLRDRLHRARAPAPTSPRCARPRRARRRRVAHQRPEDLHEHRRARRLRLARVPHRSRRAASTRASRSSSCPPTAPASRARRSTSWAAAATNATFYDDVRVRLTTSSARRTAAGSSSRTSSTTSGSRSRRRGLGRAALRRGRSRGPRSTTLADGRRVIDQEWVQVNLARVRARLEYLQLLNWKVGRDRATWPPGRRVGDQGVRHRVLHRGVPAAHGGDRAGAACCAQGSPGAAARRLESTLSRARSCSPSAAAPTRCSATSSRCSGWLGVPRAKR